MEVACLIFYTLWQNHLGGRPCPLVMRRSPRLPWLLTKGHAKRRGCTLTVMSNGYRTLSQHLNDLKRENFSLKLRIYFLEERIQQKYEESSEDVYRTVSVAVTRVCTCLSACTWKAALVKAVIGKAAGCSVSLLSWSICDLVFGIQLRLVCCRTYYSLYTDTPSWKSALVCNFYCLLTQLSCCLFYRVPVFRHGTAENDYTLTRSFPPVLCTVASLTRSLLRSHLSWDSL